MGSILIVDDDASLRRALADRLSFWGHAPFEARDGSAALSAIEKREFDLVLLDLAMPGLTGQQVLREMKARGCTADTVILTAHGSIDAAVECLKAGAADFLLKPADFDHLRQVIERLLERRQLLRANAALDERAGAGAGVVFGDSAQFHSLLETARKAARSNATILITGESGSGKQVLAELIHRESPRRAGAFVYVNCVALSDDLIESTLFGHEKGAFTGAVARKEGRLEAAAGGTAFLDEVGDITPRLQTKLLHFLETKEFERVGGTRTIQVDCRVIAATNRDVETEVREGRFREDLYFRLGVIGLRVPPLRERTDDIPILARAFLDRVASELGRGPMRFAPETLRLLSSHPWPGNVRQLKNTIERMAVLSDSDTLGPELFSADAAAPGSDAPAAGAIGRAITGELLRGADPSGLTPFRDAVRIFKREYIRQALARNGGNQTRTAEQLGLQRTFLNRLIKGYDL